MVELKRIDEFRLWLQELDQETERGACVLASTFLEELLKELIHASFVADNTLAKEVRMLHHASNIALAAALGLVSIEAKNELGTLNEIRNRFVHHRNVKTFSDPLIRQLCNKLQVPIQLSGNLRKGKEENREKFTITASFTLYYLEARKSHITRAVAPRIWAL